MTRTAVVASALHRQRITKADGFGADIVLCDLETTVPLARKAEARSIWCEVQSAQRKTPLGLRINSLHSPDGLYDLRMILESCSWPAVLVLAKVEDPHDVEVAGDLLGNAECPSRLWAHIENPRALSRGAEIARAHPRLSAISFGLESYCSKAGIDTTWESTSRARFQLVLAAKSAGIAAFDAPTLDLTTPGLLEIECRESARLGFDGKLAIHENQVKVINETFIKI